MNCLRLLPLMALALATALPATAPARADGIIDIGEVEAGYRVSGPERGVLLGLDVFHEGANSGGEQLRYFWVEARLVVDGQGAPAFVDLRFMPFGSSVSRDSTNGLFFGVFPVRYVRDEALHVDGMLSVYALRLELAADPSQNVKDDGLQFNFFVRAAADVLGVAAMHGSLQGGEQTRVRADLGALSGEVGAALTVNRDFSLRLSLGGELPVGLGGFYMTRAFQELSARINGDHLDLDAFVRRNTDRVRAGLGGDAPRESYRSIDLGLRVLFF